jgi:hypothetical protein
MTMRAVSRRAALKTIGAGAGAIAVLPFLSEDGLAAFADIQRTNAPPSLKVLTAHQYETLASLAEAIIPADERSPGAREARVADYVDLLLSEADDKVRAQWIDGLTVLDAEAAARYSAPFINLSAADTEALLIEASKHEKDKDVTRTERAPLEAFFVTAKQATVHGYYTSEIGIHRELRYKGNKVLLEFVGCQTVDGKDCPWCGQKAEA